MLALLHQLMMTGVLATEKAPDIELSSLNQQDLIIDSFDGELTIIHFWATWCPPCVKELPELNRLFIKYRNQGLKVITIAADNHTAVTRYLDKHPYDFPVYVDQYGAAMHDYKVLAMPSSYIINKDRQIIQKTTGPIDWMSAEMLDKFSAYLNTPE